MVETGMYKFTYNFDFITSCLNDDNCSLADVMSTVHQPYVFQDYAAFIHTEMKSYNKAQRRLTFDSYGGGGNGRE